MGSNLVIVVDHKASPCSYHDARHSSGGLIDYFPRRDHYQCLVYSFKYIYVSKWYVTKRFVGTVQY